FLLRSLGFSGVHVGAHHSKRPVAEEEVGLEPAALRIEVLGAELGAVRERGGAAGDSDARSSLGGRFIVDNRPARQCSLEMLVLAADLLQRQNVDFGVVEPPVHTVADSRPDSVDIDRGDTQMRHAPSLTRAGDILALVLVDGGDERVLCAPYGTCTRVSAVPGCGCVRVSGTSQSYARGEDERLLLRESCG